jgi:hypothetical protein
MEQSVVAVGRRHKQRESVQASLVDVCAAMRATAGPTVSGELIEEGQARFCRERVDAVGAYGTEPVLGGLREKNSVQLLDRPWGAGFRIGHGLFVCWPHCDVVERAGRQCLHRDPSCTKAIFGGKPSGQSGHAGRPGVGVAVDGDRTPTAKRDDLHRPTLASVASAGLRGRVECTISSSRIRSEPLIVLRGWLLMLVRAWVAVGLA